jgi:hypothetical protein
VLFTIPTYVATVVIWLDASQGLNSKIVNILSSHFGREDIEDPVATFVGIVNNTMGKGVIIIDNLLEDSGEWSIASGLHMSNCLLLSTSKCANFCA